MNQGENQNGTAENQTDAFGKIETKEELQSFLEGLRDKLSEGTSPPMFTSSALNFVLNLPNIYELMDEANKEVARDLWLRLKQAGLHLKNPPMWFDASESD